MKKDDPLLLHARQYRVVAISILLSIFCCVLGWTSPAYAEGSRSLYPSGAAGYRADLDLEPAVGQYLGKVLCSTFLYVYAEAVFGIFDLFV